MTSAPRWRGPWLLPGFRMQLKVEWRLSLADIDKQRWNRLAEPLDTPFFEWDWLESLERTGCLGGRTGWAPCHLTVWRGEDLIAAAPLYLKGHSRGEFVFDHEWAAVSHELGVPYYPKMLGMSPFTPAGGYRFLIAEGEDQQVLCRLMLEMIDRFCKENEIAGCHFLRVDPDWRGVMENLGVGSWLHHALIWENADYGGFDDYVASFKSRQRNNIRRERKALRCQGLRFEVIPGERATDAHFKAMHAFYEDTCHKFYGWSHYLNRRFFEALAERMAHRLAFSAAYAGDDETPAAMSLLVHKGPWLFGRYWGARRQFDHLHFECCYYQPIEWAISKGMRWFDAGSGSADHKRRRGFPARPSYSLHRFYHPIMDQVWRDNIDRVNEMEREHIDIINGDKPLPDHLRGY